MIDVITSAINSDGRIQAIEFGKKNPGASQYVCVKGEKLPNGRGIRFIVHDAAENQSALEDNLRYIISFVANKGFTSRNGNYNQLGEMIDYSDVAVVSDDNTISMEALFLMPTKSF